MKKSSHFKKSPTSSSFSFQDGGILPQTIKEQPISEKIDSLIKRIDELIE